MLFGTGKTIRFIYSEITDINGSIQLFWEVTKQLIALKDRTTRNIVYKQIYHTGVEPMGLIILTGIFIGLLIITQTNSFFGENKEVVSKLLVWTVVRELSPLLVAALVISRSGTIITSELAAMKLKREIDSIIVMGIDPLRFIVIPRVIGITIAMFVLTFYFQTATVAGGLAFSSILTGIEFNQYFKEIFSTISFMDMIISLSKSIVFGIIISSTSCYHGIKQHTSIVDVSLSTKTAVMQNIHSIVILDGIATIAYYL